MRPIHASGAGGRRSRPGKWQALDAQRIMVDFSQKHGAQGGRQAGCFESSPASSEGTGRLHERRGRHGGLLRFPVQFLPTGRHPSIFNRFMRSRIVRADGWVSFTAWHHLCACDAKTTCTVGGLYHGATARSPRQRWPCHRPCPSLTHDPLSAETPCSFSQLPVAPMPAQRASTRRQNPRVDLSKLDVSHCLLHNCVFCMKLCTTKNDHAPRPRLIAV